MLQTAYIFYTVRLSLTDRQRRYIMKKRLLSFISAAVLVLVLVALYACNGSNNEKNPSDASDASGLTTEWSAQDEWSYISKK